MINKDLVLVAKSFEGFQDVSGLGPTATPSLFGAPTMACSYTFAARGQSFASTVRMYTCSHNLCGLTDI